MNHVPKNHFLTLVVMACMLLTTGDIWLSFVKPLWPLIRDILPLLIGVFIALTISVWTFGVKKTGEGVAAIAIGALLSITVFAILGAIFGSDDD